MLTAPVKAIALPAANLEFQSHVPFQQPRTRVMDSRTRGRRGFCTLLLVECYALWEIGSIHAHAKLELTYIQYNITVYVYSDRLRVQPREVHMKLYAGTGRPSHT